MTQKIRVIFITVISLLLCCSLLFSAACSSDRKEPAANEEGVDAIMSVEYDVEELPLALVNSVEELKQVIEKSKTEKASDNRVDSGRDLASMEYFYVPTAKFENHKLFKIEVLERYIIYYYVPKDAKQDQPFDYNTGITVIFSRTPKDDPLASAVEQAGISLTEDNILYEKDINSATFAIEDTRMSICVPDELNNYDYLKILVSPKKSSWTTEMNL